MLTKFKKSQSTLEYALLIGLVVGGLLSMQNYLKRGLQGRFQAIGDQFGDQYSPENTFRTETMAVTQDTIIEETIGGAFAGGRDGAPMDGTAGIAGTTRTEVRGGSQSSTSERELRSLDEEEWPE